MDRKTWKALILCTSAAVAASALLVTGCGESTAPLRTGDVQILLKASERSLDVLASVHTLGSSHGPIALDDVDHIHVVVASVDALRVGGGQGAPWVSLDVQAGGDIDLLDLGATGIELASGELVTGTYTNLRLFVESATITLNRSVTIGEHEYAAGAHELTIPSAGQTGIKTIGVSFRVVAESLETVVLEFDPGTTVQNLAATGNGKIIMNPVLKQGGE